MSQEELSRQLGLKQSAISKIERGKRKIAAVEAKKIAIALGTTMESLISEEDLVIPGQARVAATPRTRGGKERPQALPLLSMEECRFSFEKSKETAIEWIPVPAEDMGAKRYFLQAKGSSMSPTIEDGERILVDPALIPRNGDIVVALWQGECTIKRFFRFEGRTELKTDDPSHPTIMLGPSDQLEIRGVVVSVQKKLRH